uniref:G-protein coupled receptors family 1 profile domain-containing protein n=1 Tax=Magallana gigas TaxID=29159 RepID=A0A8W8J6U2_MAGGI
MSDVNLAFRDWNMGALVLISVIILPGILGNSLVMAIFYREFKKSAYRTFVLWLAVLDLAGCLLVMPYLLVNIVTPVSMDNEVVCKVGRFLSYVIMMTSHFILVVIAVDSSLDIGIPGLKATRCFTADKYKDSPAHLIYYIVINVVGAMVTLLISVLYFQVIRKIRKQFQENERTLHPSVPKLQHSGTLVDYSVGSFFCRLSFAEGVAYNTAMYFFLLNSVLNSVIYGFTDKRFKRRFLLLFKRQQFNVNNQETTDGTSSNNVI